MKNSSSLINTVFRVLEQIRLKKVAMLLYGLLVLATLGCVIAIATRDVFAYILCLIMLITAILFGLLVLADSIVWKLLPENFKKAYGAKKIRLSVIIFFSILLFLFIAVIVDVFCLPDAPGFISLLSKTATFVFAVFFGWRLIRRTKVKTIAAGSIVFILFIALLSFASSTSFKSSEIARVNPIQKLKSLPYVSWIPAEGNIEKTGVIQYYADLAFDGTNIYNSITLPEAYLVDMHGNTVHKWSARSAGCNSGLEHVKMCKNGDLLVVVADQMLIRLDWNSNVKWDKKMRTHHDVNVDENKNIYVITREDKLAFWHGIPVPILNDCIVVLSQDGEIRKKLSVYDLVKEQLSLRTILGIYRGIFKAETLMRILYYRVIRNYNLCTGTPFDILHTNSIEIIDRDIHGFCKKGDWLTSIRQLNLIGVVDAKKQELVWSWGPGELDMQHHPTLLENGNILVFDNGCYRTFSRIVELNPSTKKIVWEYKSDPPDTFFSQSRGCKQRLPNGNTLITESTKGHVFEVTREGKIVWEFYNPRVRTKTKKREAIYRMMRITNPEIYKLIKRRI